MLLACLNRDIRDNVIPGRLEEFDALELFEDEFAAGHQAGKFKSEGVFTEAYFRNLKTYHLSGSASGSCVRVRSVPRKAHLEIPKASFGPMSKKTVVRTVGLKPTVGFEMTKTAESKSLTHCLNFKRMATVSSDRPTPSSLFSFVKFFLFLPHRRIPSTLFLSSERRTWRRCGSTS